MVETGYKKRTPQQPIEFPVVRPILFSLPSIKLCFQLPSTLPLIGILITEGKYSLRENYNEAPN